jgi:hypothetical protein
MTTNNPSEGTTHVNHDQDKPTAEWELITPEIAEALLECNSNNRNLRPGRVNKYARAMDLDDWGKTGQPIIIGSDGNLMDGQHRLMAVAQTRRSVWFLVVRGVDPNLMAAIDRGLARGGMDAFNWAGIPNAASAAASLRQILVLVNGGSLLQGHLLNQITDQELLDAYPQYENVMLWAAPLASRVAHTIKIAPAKYLTAMVWLSVNDCNAESIQAFTEQLITGADLAEDSPILALRNWALNVKAMRKALRRDEVLIATIKAWNDVAEGRHRKLMRVKPDEAIPAVVPH